MFSMVLRGVRLSVIHGQITRGNTMALKCNIYRITFLYVKKFNQKIHGFVTVPLTNSFQMRPFSTP